MFSQKSSNINLPKPQSQFVTLYVSAPELEAAKLQQNLTAIGGLAKINEVEGDYSYVSKASALAYVENDSNAVGRVIFATTHEKIGGIQNSLVKVCIRLNSADKILFDYCDCDTGTTGLIAYAQIIASNISRAIGQLVEIRRIEETSTTLKSYAFIVPQFCIPENGICIG